MSANGKLFESSIMYAGKAIRAFLSEARFKAPLSGRLQALTTNITLDCKGFPGENALAYYEHLKFLAVKFFVILGSGPNVIKLFYLENYECS